MDITNDAVEIGHSWNETNTKIQFEDAKCMFASRSEFITYLKSKIKIYYADNSARLHPAGNFKSYLLEE